MTKHCSAIVAFCFVSTAMVFGQVRHDLTAEPQTIPLWEKGAPGALGQGDDDKPTLTVYQPWGPNPLRRLSSRRVAVMDFLLPTTKAGKWRTGSTPWA